MYISLDPLEVDLALRDRAASTIAQDLLTHLLSDQTSLALSTEWTRYLQKTWFYSCGHERAYLTHL